MPAIPSCIIDLIWDQFTELLPERKVEHPLGCHHLPACPTFCSVLFLLTSASGVTPSAPASFRTVPGYAPRSPFSSR